MICFTARIQVIYFFSVNVVQEAVQILLNQPPRILWSPHLPRITGSVLSDMHVCML